MAEVQQLGDAPDQVLLVAMQRSVGVGDPPELLDEPALLLERESGVDARGELPGVVSVARLGLREGQELAGRLRVEPEAPPNGIENRHALAVRELRVAADDFDDKRRSGEASPAGRLAGRVVGLADDLLIEEIPECCKHRVREWTRSAARGSVPAQLPGRRV